MTALKMLASIAAALVLQTTLARFLVRGSIGVDLVLVVVVYLSLRSGPTVGIVSGTVAGLAQDALTTGVVGIGGLGKTIVGYLAGTVGTVFIVAQPLPRFLVFFVGTIIEMTAITGFHALLDPGPHLVPVGAIVAQAFGNSLVGIVLFQLADALPRIAERSRTGRD
ncbi:MAG TPA: rod shape-determining protein MreD [Vicinamibacterales bacterium]